MEDFKTELPNQLLNILAYWTIVNSEQYFKVLSPSYLNEKFERYIGRSALISSPEIKSITLDEYLDQWSVDDIDLLKITMRMFHHITDVYTLPNFVNKYFDYSKISSSDNWRWGLHPILVDEFKALVHVVEPNTMEQMYILILSKI